MGRQARAPLVGCAEEITDPLGHLALSAGLDLSAAHQAPGQPPSGDLRSNQQLTPLIYGSANNLVAAFYDRDGKRLIFDGGFTRLYNKWDTAGTGRYVKNAAAWLANVERFPTTHASR